MGGSTLLSDARATPSSDSVQKHRLQQSLLLLLLLLLLVLQQSPSPALQPAAPHTVCRP
jgi:hypothetical protein